MKKIFTLALTAAMMLGGVNASAQTEYTILENLTNKIQNADFSADEAVSGIEKICTYDYDMSDVTVGESDVTKGRFGLQAVTGWTANFPSDNVKVMENSGSTARTDNANAKAGGIFAYRDPEGEDGTGLGGTYYPPYSNTIENSTKALGIVAVWGAEAAYTQDITLPAGAYMMIVQLWNDAGTSEFITCGNGFIAEGGAQYVSKNKTFATGVWVNDTIVFLLEEETAGKLSLGYKSGNYGSGGAAHLFIDNVQLYSIDKTPLIQAEIEAAKEQLKALIDEGEKTGADVTEATAIYNKSNATLEEVLAAIEKQEELNKAVLTDLSAFFLDNPHFTLDTPLPEDEGICTYDYDMKDPNGSNGRKVSYYGMQEISGWTANKLSDNTEVSGRSDGKNGRACGIFALGSNSFLGGAAFLPPTTMSDGATEGNLLGFVGVWTALSQYTQKRTLPAGDYKLVISYYNAGGTGEIAKNLMGFVEENGTEHLGTTKKWEVGQWLKDEIEFTLAEDTPGYFTVGYTAANAGSGSMPHFFIDGISLYYVGETAIDPSLMGLQAAISAAQKYQTEAFSAALKSELNQAISAGQKLIDDKSTDATANKAAADAITALVPQVTANIKAYQELDAFIGAEGALAKAYDKYPKATYPELNAGLDNLSDEAYDANSDYTWTTGEINAAIASLDDIIKNGVQKAWDAALASTEPMAQSIDISALFDQLAYTYDTAEKKGSNVPDKEWTSNAGDNFKTQYGAAEVWNKSPFTVSCTLPDMPAGTYLITTKAFYREASNSSNYTKYTEDALTDLAFIFAGNNKQALTNVATIAEDEHEGWAAIVENEGPYVPNGLKAAHDIFEDEEYKEKVETSVATVLTNTGDLTFGIKGDEMESDSWVVWYTFSIKYNNVITVQVLREGLKNLIDEVSDYTSEHEDDMNDYAKNAVATVLEDAEAKVDKGTVAEVKKATEDLTQAYADAQENVATWTAFIAARDNIEATAEECAETANDEALEAYGNLDLYNKPKNMTTEELKAFIEEVNSIAQDLRIPNGYDTASDGAPFDMTAVIVNPSFEDEDISAWTWNSKASGDTGRREIANATYTVAAPEGEDIGLYVFNTWNSSAPEGGYYVKQALTLPAGTYELKVLLASNQGAVIQVSANETSDEFTMAEAKEKGQYGSIIFKLDEKGSVEIQVSSDSWFKADDFTLTYFGTSSEKVPTAIEGVGAPAKKAYGAKFNIAGQRVGAGYKGIVIKDGRKYYNK